ncbi:hypothetical protein BW723_13795 [Polaribacter reichenbachii]|uniref:DUF4252 domain-containing protein n=1 Tax=Polaribacter reichenbachii TaxID=996801 RepID=A0A1B8U1L4_9FLAO|nr:DUF4252 domain-containing protein [Polaribacter reichenbachii]APZ47289.1 hypothetical protein BW723_13795 [Polaribacter reichenbachii]AUC17930.1 hypothetical protein BTO17_04250 [Polaribacter reichenbachii]OBY65745.1 hypothetical protein LPB301_07985 [Polaribacter reichenbachii]
MKKIILLIAFVVAPMVTSAQSLFDSLEDMDGVDMVVVTKDAFQLLKKFQPKNVKSDDNEVIQAFEMIGDLKEFKMFSTNDLDIASKMESMVNTSIKSKKLTQLMRIKDDGSRVKIYVKATSNKDYVSEVLMFVKGIDKQTKGVSEAIVFSLTGNIDINKMSEYTDKIVKENK